MLTAHGNCNIRAISTSRFPFPNRRETEAVTEMRRNPSHCVSHVPGVSLPSPNGGPCALSHYGSKAPYCLAFSDRGVAQPGQRACFGCRGAQQIKPA